MQRPNFSRGPAILAGALLLSAAAASGTHVRQLIAEDRWSEALTQARELARLEPGPASATVLGEALYRAGRIDEAGDALAPVVAAAEPPARAMAQLGLVRAAQGREEEAEPLFERAAAAAPDDPWVLVRAAGGVSSRARASALLKAYVERSAGEDPDRVEGARGTIRLYDALGDRKVWVSTARPETAEIPLKPLPSGGVFVEASLANKKKIRLLLDTGSTGLFVVARAVKKAGFVPLSEETVFAGGGSGRTPSSRGLLQRFELGGVAFADALVTTTTSEFDPQGRIHGVLGINIFAGYRVTIDLAKGRMTLDPSRASAGGAPYWDVGGQMLVHAETTGGPSGLFLFDTGATRSMLDTRFAASIPGARSGAATGVATYGGNVAGAVTVRGAALRFLGIGGGAGDLHAADLTQRSRLGGVEVSGYLGLDVLARTRIVIDTGARRVDVAASAARD